MKNDRKLFGAFAAMPPPKIDVALKEIEYCLDVLKLDGIGLLTNYEGKYLGDASFVPIFVELNPTQGRCLHTPDNLPLLQDVGSLKLLLTLSNSARTRRAVSPVLSSAAPQSVILASVGSGLTLLVPCRF